MDQRTAGFIGGGRVVSIILHGWRRAGMLPSKIVVSDSSSEVLNRLSSCFAGVTTTGDNLLSAGQDFVFMALHPPSARTALDALGAALKPDAVVISLAPVLRFEELATRLGGFRRLVRMIPNAPSAIGQGYNPVCHAPEIADADRQALGPLLDALGTSPVVPEEHLEAYAILTAMGPTYFWHQWQALRELGGSFGLKQGEVDEGLLKMIEGAARMLLAAGLPAAEVMDTIPIRPLADTESPTAAAYREKLGALHQKLRNASCEHLAQNPGK